MKEEKKREREKERNRQTQTETYRQAEREREREKQTNKQTCRGDASLCTLSVQSNSGRSHACCVLSPCWRMSVSAKGGR